MAVLFACVGALESCNLIMELHVKNFFGWSKLDHFSEIVNLENWL